MIIRLLKKFESTQTACFKNSLSRSKKSSMNTMCAHCVLTFRNVIAFGRSLGKKRSKVCRISDMIAARPGSEITSERKRSCNACRGWRSGCVAAMTRKNLRRRVHVSEFFSKRMVRKIPLHTVRKQRGAWRADAAAEAVQQMPANRPVQLQPESELFAELPSPRLPVRLGR
jgi:hypothetical protein